MAGSVQRINDGKQFFADRMRALGFAVLPTEGNFMHVAFGEVGRTIHAALKDRVLYRAEFSHPALAGFSRFSVAPRATMARVAELIEQTAARAAT
jgi:histidinol-phosphate aminotransferase